MGLLFLLSDPSTMGWGLTRSKLIAAEVAIINNFLWNDFWTFRDIADQQRGTRYRLQRFAKFQLVCFVGLVAQYAAAECAIQRAGHESLCG